MVMTTEVLRNMLTPGHPAQGLGFVVLDEVHYLADRSRGAVWEEVIIHLPESVALVALSATVSNAEEFGDWLDSVRGGVTVIVDEHRPVPLWQHMLVGTRMYDLFTDPAGRGSTRNWSGWPSATGGRPPTAVTGNSRPGRGGRRDVRGRRNSFRPGAAVAAHVPSRPPYRPDVVARLDSAGLLPAIEFVFSRAGCDAAVQQCLAAGLRLSQPDEIADDHRVGRAADHRHPGRGPGRARVRRVPDRAAARYRRAPRRDAAHVQGDRRGAVLGWPGPGGVRDRDAGAGHQHAGQDRGHREAGQVER